MAIHFYSVDMQLRLSGRKFLKHFLIDLALKEGYALKELTFIFCTDNYLLDINQRFLNHDTFTDIITFPLTDDTGIISGEIYISLERVKENAIKFNCSENDELVRVICHGLLHLCGYRDKTRDEKESMRKKEDFYLALYNKQ
ncbi:rRNA maturation RNase YbeY [soil metagenome]